MWKSPPQSSQHENPVGFAAIAEQLQLAPGRVRPEYLDLRSLRRAVGVAREDSHMHRVYLILGSLPDIEVPGAGCGVAITSG